MCTHARACRGGEFPLFVASKGGHLSCVEALVHFKADVMQRSSCVFSNLIEGFTSMGLGLIEGFGCRILDWCRVCVALFGGEDAEESFGVHLRLSLQKGWQVLLVGRIWKRSPFLR